MDNGNTACYTILGCLMYRCLSLFGQKKGKFALLSFLFVLIVNCLSETFPLNVVSIREKQRSDFKVLALITCSVMEKDM